MRMLLIFGECRKVAIIISLAYQGNIFTSVFSTLGHDRGLSDFSKNCTCASLVDAVII